MAHPSPWLIPLHGSSLSMAHPTPWLTHTAKNERLSKLPYLSQHNAPLPIAVCLPNQSLPSSHVFTARANPSPPPPHTGRAHTL
eukprot:358247-Chlamydomonas_euryale.AAC.1